MGESEDPANPTPAPDDVPAENSPVLPPAMNPEAAEDSLDLPPAANVEADEISPALPPAADNEATENSPNLPPAADAGATESSPDLPPAASDAEIVPPFAAAPPVELVAPARRSRSALASGFAGLAGWRTLVVLFIAANVVAAPLVLSTIGDVKEIFGGTLAGAAIRENRTPDASLYFVDFVALEKPHRAMGPTLLLGAVLTVLAQIFLTGGIIETVGRERRGFLAEFLAGCGRHFVHNLKAFAVFGISLAIGLGIWMSATGALRNALFGGNAEGAEASAAGFGASIFGAVQGLVALLLFALLSLAYDFSRALPRVAGPLPYRQAWKRGWRILLSAPGRGLGIFFFWLLAGGAIYGFFLAAEWQTFPATAGQIFGVFLLQRLVILVRSAVRLATWGSLTAFVENRFAA